MRPITLSPVQHQIAKIERATCLDVHMTTDGHGWWLACADKVGPSHRRPVATAEGTGPFEALDKLTARLGYRADDNGDLHRIAAEADQPAEAA